MRTSSSEKLVLDTATRILIIGNSRLKIATACYLKSHFPSVTEVFAGSRDPVDPKNMPMRMAGVKVVQLDMSVPSMLLPAMQESRADAVFLVLPAGADKTEMMISGLSACKRAGVGHVVFVSSTCVEASKKSVLEQQCAPIEEFSKTSGLTYTILRIPYILDDYLSQLKSMVTHGVFYGPLSPRTRHSVITVADVAEAASHVLAYPGKYADTTLSLHGCTVTCEEVSGALGNAFGKLIVYEQVTCNEYAEMLLSAGLPSHQIDGYIQLSQLIEAQDTFSVGSPTALIQILQRPPTNVKRYARAISAKFRHEQRHPDSLIKDLQGPLPHIGDRFDDDSEIYDDDFDDELALYPLSPWVVSLECTMNSQLYPAGLSAIMTVGYAINDGSCGSDADISHHSADVPGNGHIRDIVRSRKRSHSGGSGRGEQQRVYDGKTDAWATYGDTEPFTSYSNSENGGISGSIPKYEYEMKSCILIHGVLTILPPGSLTQSHTRTISHMGSQSFDLRDYTVRRSSALRLLLSRSSLYTTRDLNMPRECGKQGKTDESIDVSDRQAIGILLELSDADDCTRWHDVLSAHIAHKCRQIHVGNRGGRWQPPTIMACHE